MRRGVCSLGENGAVWKQDKRVAHKGCWGVAKRSGCLVAAWVQRCHQHFLAFVIFMQGVGGFCQQAHIARDVHGGQEATGLLKWLGGWSMLLFLVSHRPEKVHCFG